MGTPFLAELKIVSFNFAPKGWALSNGQLLPINQNQALFSLLGTTYGGNGQTTFGLPDLRARAAIHVGSGFIQGQAGGETAHTLTTQEMPSHTHFVTATNADADAPVALGGRLARFNNGYRSPSALTAIGASVISNVGGSQAHENMSPFLVLNYVIALQGIFPSRN